MARHRSPSEESRDLELGAIQQDTLRLARQDVRADNLDLRIPLSEFFKQGLPVNIFGPVCTIWASWHKDSILSWLGCISAGCLVTCFILHIICLESRNIHLRCKLAYWSVFLRIVGATLLLLTLDPAVRHLVVISPLLLLALVLLCCFFKETFSGRRQPGQDWGGNKAELKLWFGLSCQVVNFAFAGLLGTVLGYVKDSNQLLSGRGRGRGYMAPDCFLTYSLILGLLLQLLSTVPTFIWIGGTRIRMAKVYLRIVAYASLMFLVLASVIAAEGILREWVSIACFIVVVIPVLFFWLENRLGKGPDWFQEENGQLRGYFRTIPTASTATAGEEQDDDMGWQTVILGFIALMFSALMASNSKYSIERSGTAAAVPLSWWFKCSVLLELYGVLSYAVRMVVFSEMPPEMRSLAFTKMVWCLSTVATIILTIIVVFVVLVWYPDEIKNIF